MAHIKDGGPAFPHMMVKGHVDYAGGMSLRDWFAGQAFAGELANPSNGTWRSSASNEDLAHRAAFIYRFADAMIASRGDPDA